MNSDLMIVEAMRNGLVLRVISVVVVTSVSPIVGIESGDAERTEEFLPRDQQSAPGVVGVEQLGCDGHTDGKIAPELVVAPGVAAVKRVFVDAGFVH